MDLRQEFLTPSDEFTPIPFWFWNDELSESEITRQIDDFQEKGVMGFVIHPRKGMPETIPYLSDRYMHYVEHAVKEAQKRNMRVVLYDEAMYPSGSAHGLVVKENPAYATRALRMEEGTTIPQLESGETLLAVVTAKQNEDGTLQAKTLQEIPVTGCETGLQDSAFFLIEGFSHGTIRGMHIGEDDLEEDAPPSGDLLNPEAMAAFIRITYERYYEVLKPYFGNTVIAMFTDEPCVTGRCARPGIKAWTIGYAEDWKSAGGSIKDLPLLWKETSDDSHEKVRRLHKETVNKRLSESYYRQISEWCESHNIALAGHPAGSDDIGVLKYFHIPGQDVVWRWVAPENETRIEGVHSTLGKCSADAARHYGRRRNSNECMGCCGPKISNWGFTANDMKWYLDWLFVRGVNLLYPHAFFYSINGEDRFGERPPDVGPNNLFWPHYRQFADYIKRMSWLNTDSYNTTPIAILGEEAHLPWEPAKELFCNQIEFNYLEDNLLIGERCKIQDGAIWIEKQSYRVIIADSEVLACKSKIQEKLQAFISQGGKVIYWNRDDILAELPEDCKEIQLTSACSSGDIRISHVVKHNTDFYLVVNEGEEIFAGIAEIPYTALVGGPADYQVERWDAWKGTQEPIQAVMDKDVLHVPMTLARRESVVLYIAKCPFVDISDKFQLGSWTEQKEMETFSGTVKYKTTLQCESVWKRMILDLGEVHEIATVKVNDKMIGTKMWAPYQFDIGDVLQVGENTIEIDVSNTPANKLEKAKLVSGLLGPVKLIGG